MRVYLAGPMTGYPNWNYAAFEDATENMRLVGWDVVSPVELDRESGNDADGVETLPDGYREKAMRRDIEALLTVDAIVLLPGWQRSKGAQLEKAVAEGLGLDVRYYTENEWGWGHSHEPEPDDHETALQEAQRLVHGDRNAAYGHPADDFARTGRMWGAILGIGDVPPELVGLCMCAVKISREVNKPKRDNRVDLAGYAETVEMIHQRRETTHA